jgi:hypothetical protein
VEERPKGAMERASEMLGMWRGTYTQEIVPIDKKIVGWSITYKKLQ